MPYLKSKIPVAYAHLIPELLEIQFPEEKLSSCDNCTLCQTDKSPYLNSKCCNYHPLIPNFQLGNLLSSQSDLHPGKKRVLDLIQSAQGISPWGLTPSSAYLTGQQEILKLDQVFQSEKQIESQLCPFFDEGNCSIWSWRDHLCVSYFCISSAGENGQRFWRKLDQILAQIEFELAQLALKQAGFVFNSTYDQALQSALEAEQFEHSEFQAEAYFIRCHEFIRDFDKSSFDNLTMHWYPMALSELKNLAQDFARNTYPELMHFHPDLYIEHGEHEILLQLNDNTFKCSPVVWLLLKQYDGKKSTTDVFKTGHRILYNLAIETNQLFEAGMLISAQ